jgi:tRNA threonylcarbamoyladenosine biosynthesis protein TsaB
VAQGLAFGADLPVVPVNSLVACAEQTRATLPTGTAVTIALDARMDECYWASFVPADAANNQVAGVALHTGQGKTGQVAVADALRVLHALGHVAPA